MEKEEVVLLEFKLPYGKTGLFQGVPCLSSWKLGEKTIFFQMP